MFFFKANETKYNVNKKIITCFAMGLSVFAVWKYSKQKRRLRTNPEGLKKIFIRPVLFYVLTLVVVFTQRKLTKKNPYQDVISGGLTTLASYVLFFWLLNQQLIFHKKINVVSFISANILIIQQVVFLFGLSACFLSSYTNEYLICACFCQWVFFCQDIRRIFTVMGTKYFLSVFFFLQYYISFLFLFNSIIHKDIFFSLVIKLILILGIKQVLASFLLFFPYKIGLKSLLGNIFIFMILYFYIQRFFLNKLNFYEDFWVLTSVSLVYYIIFNIYFSNLIHLRKENHIYVLNLFDLNTQSLTFLTKSIFFVLTKKNYEL